MAVTIIENFVIIPDQVKVKLEEKKVMVEGEKGKLARDFKHAKIELDLKGEGIRVWAVNPRKREASLVNTILKLSR